MINKIKHELLDNGCNVINVGGREIFVKDNLYIRIDYVKDWDEYVIETAGSREDAEKNLFEDSGYISSRATNDEIKEAIVGCLE